MPAAPTFPRRHAIVAAQLEELDALLRPVQADNPFYRGLLENAHLPRRIRSVDDFTSHMPFTTKDQIVADQAVHPPYGSNLTFPLERYTRCHQTSGTSGPPLRWLDTPESWDWMLRNWELIHRAAGVGPSDRLFFAFSFGPFLGFWTAFESAARLGCFTLTGGGLSSAGRLRAIFEHRAQALYCTPSYAIHLAEVAAAEGISLSESPLRLLHVAGEPGGSIPATRARLEALWPGARVCDHHGMTEVGPVSLQCPAHPDRLHVLESAYFAEVIAPAAGEPSAPGEMGELVLTTLGRIGSPLLRYRTGDLVRPVTDGPCDCGRYTLALAGGILSRTDDMIVVRGVNVYPAAVEQLIRSLGGVGEYRLAAVGCDRSTTLTQLSVEIEPEPDVTDATALARRLEQAFDTALSLRVPVNTVPRGTLPRPELKARRWVVRGVPAG